MPAPAKAGAGGKQHMRQRTNALLPLAKTKIGIPKVGFMPLTVSTSADCYGLLTLQGRHLMPSVSPHAGPVGASLP